MTGTDPSGRRSRRSGPSHPRGRGAVRALGLALGLAVAGATVPGGLGAQERQVLTVRSGSGWIGVNVRVATSDVEEDVITFTDVLAGSPAAAAGLEPGDRVIRVNGAPVTADRFRSITSRLQAGDPIALTVVRGDEELELSVIAGERPAPAQIVAVRLQEELDSVRSHLVRILAAPEPPDVQAVRVEGNRFVQAPTIRVEQVGTDSIATRIVIQASEGPVVSWVETPEGIRAAEIIRVPGGAEVSDVEVERMIQEAEERALVISGQARAAAEPGWVPLRRGLAEPEARARREAELRGGAFPTRSIEEVRPLSPYLAGMTRVAGAELRALNPGLAQYFGVEEGLLVTEVSEGTPAALAGLRGGDVIVASGGRQVTTLAQLRESLAGRDGRELEVIRAGERLSTTLR